VVCTEYFAISLSPQINIKVYMYDVLKYKVLYLMPHDSYAVLIFIVWLWYIC
jgi:hypothetical protein